MISEKRIKELAEELWRHPKVLFQTDDYEIVLETLAQYFRTVAAEAREEGIEEMLEVGRKKVWDVLNQKRPIARVLVLRLQEEAKRLKEKGK